MLQKENPHIIYSGQEFKLDPVGKNAKLRQNYKKGKILNIAQIQDEAVAPSKENIDPDTKVKEEYVYEGEPNYPTCDDKCEICPQLLRKEPDVKKT